MNRTARDPFFAWPGWPHIRWASILIFFVTVWFCVAFAGANWFTAHRTAHVRVDLALEAYIPLVPAFTLIYMSIYQLFLAVPFVLRTKREVRNLAIVQSMTVLIAGICFLLIPAKLAFVSASDSELGVWKSLFRFADRLNLDYNLVPSLHVALSIVCIEFFCVHASRAGKIVLRIWGLAIAASTLLTHQHHLMDVGTGYLLALGVVKLTHRAKMSANMTTPIPVPREASTVSYQ
jgi:hypothetical protein